MRGPALSAGLIIHEAGPGVSVQDRGRPGFLAVGLSRGGAADRLALDEAEALLGHAGAALEMAGFGGTFSFERPVRFALTGAPMQADLDGMRLTWHAVHRAAPGQVLRIGGAISGVYGYLSVGGGLATQRQLASRATHRIAGLGCPVTPGMRLPLGDDPGGEAGLVLPVGDRFRGGVLRVVASVQTETFSDAVLSSFLDTDFTRTARGNRQGIELEAGGKKFAAADGLSVLSELIVPGDIQMTGDGQPFVLLAECQTTGGYPRIATVIPPDMPRAAQCAPGAGVRFDMVSLDEAVDAMRRAAEARKALPAKAAPLLRDPATVNLLDYNLISGVV